MLNTNVLQETLPKIPGLLNAREDLDGQDICSGGPCPADQRRPAPNACKIYYPKRRQRLRERFRKTSFAGFSKYEALELLLTYTIPHGDIKPVVMALIKKFGGFQEVLDATFEELSSVKGMDENSATFIITLKPCASLYLKQSLIKKKKISSTTDLIKYCMTEMKGLKNEQFRAIFLNSQNEMLAEEIIQEGTVDQTVVYPRKVMERALHHKASGMIFVHNHPSGRFNPSIDDIRLTAVLKQAANCLQLKVHDHLIISRAGYYSFRESELEARIGPQKNPAPWLGNDKAETFSSAC